MPAKYVALFTFCFAFLVACGGGVTPIPSPAPTATQVVAQITPTNTTQPTATATLEPTATPSPTATSLPTATATPNLACPAGGQATSFTLPTDETDFQNKVQTFLSEGGTVEELMAVAEQLELLHDTAEVDLNGDGVNEQGVYLGFFDVGTQGHLWLMVQCLNHQYQILYESTGMYAFHSSFMVQDVDNNQQDELVVLSGFLGSACAFEPQIWSWRDGQVVGFSLNHLEAQLGCPSELVLEDKDGDNILELILVGYTVSHMDSPPPRLITQTLALTEGSYQLVETVYAPAVYRMELLSDAQRALNEGNLTLVSHFYTQAAYDEIDTIGSYLYHHNEVEESPENYQKAFALFRLMVVQLALREEEAAGVSLTDLQTIYPADVPGHEFAVLAQLFYESYAKNQDNAEACLAVTTYIEVHYDSSDQPGLTSHFYWGSSVSSYYQPADLCPVVK